MDKRAEHYSAGIMSESPWFLEFKKLVQFYHSGMTYDEVRHRCIEENVFGMQTERRVVSTFQYLNRRYQFMDNALVNLFCNSDLATQKLINLIAAVSGDRLFFEFLNEVYREKCILGFEKIETSDVNTFFRNKSVESEELASWKESLKPSFVRRFDELKEKAEHCNNIANLQSINVEVDALKTRCLQEIVDHEPKPVPPDDRDTPPQLTPAKVKRVYSFKSINTAKTWEMETVADVDKYLQELRSKLISKLDDDTVVHIEF